MSKSVEMVKSKKLGFRANWSEMGNKVIIIVPKNYHDDIKRMNKTVEVIIEDIDSEASKT